MENKEDNVQMFALFSDGGNCYSRYDDANWYWTASQYDEDEKSFKKRVRAQAKRKAETNYREYLANSMKCKFFKSIDKFKKECAKVGITPNLSEYE